MSLDFKAELSTILDEELKYGYEVPFTSVSKLSKKIYEELQLFKYMSEMDVIHSLTSIIIDCVKDIPTESAEEQAEARTLRDLFDDTTKVDLLNKKIRDYFRSIPKGYTIVFNLKNVIYSESIEIKLNDKITLKFESQYANMLDKLLIKEPKVYSLFVYIQHTGYLNSTNFDEPHSVLKQFI